MTLKPYDAYCKSGFDHNFRLKATDAVVKSEDLRNEGRFSIESKRPSFLGLMWLKFVIHIVDNLNDVIHASGFH